jgi:nucleoside-diphosphate-sugar epimerase
MKQNERVLVTGANGLLGTNTIIELLNQGYYVTGLLRDKKSFMGYYHNHLKLVEGDILNNNDIKKSLLNCKYVIHIAATTDPKHSKYSDFEKINVTGTINVVENAIQKNLKRIIYVSSANVFGYGSLDNLGDESKQMMSPFSKSIYSKSKKEAQDYVLTKKNEIEVVVVNPSFMIGAYDSKPSSGKIILMGLKSPIIFSPPGGKNFVCVKDVSKGIVTALNQASTGEVYLLSNVNMSYRIFFKLLRSHTKSKTIILMLPKFVILSMGWFGNCLRFVGYKTQFSLDNMRILCVKNYYSNSKAQKELGITFSPIEIGISEAVDWFRKNNMC